MRKNFSLKTENPNDGIGGGGCFCSDTKCEDCKGPYFVAHGLETDNNLSPFVVIGASCVQLMSDELTGISEADVVDSEDESE